MNIVVIGGGTGSTVVLEGLKRYKDLNLKVIVGMMDDGGSNAVVRDEFGLLPLSDIRKSIIALSDSSDNDFLRNLFTYRFSEGEKIKGHTLGNLLMIAATDILDDEVTAIKMLENMFNVRGSVIPVTLDDVRLEAEYDDGSKVVGEHYIDEPETDKNITNFSLSSKAKAYQEAVEAIESADYLILGPGDLFTTLLPNLLVEGIPEAICKSRGKIIFISNLMTKIGQTRHRTQKQILAMVEGYLGKPVDYLIINNGKIPKNAFQRYLSDGENIIQDDLTGDSNHTIIRKDVVANDKIKREKGDELARSFVRHDSKKVAAILYDIFNKNPLKRFLNSIFSQYID